MYDRYSDNSKVITDPDRLTLYNNEELTFRFADLDDLPLIIETRKKVMLADNWRPENFDESVKAEEKNIPFMMKEEWLIFCFAFDKKSGKFAGMGGLYDDNKSCSAVGEGMLARGYFFTEPEFRGRGVMHKIAEFLIKEANKRGCGRVTFHIDDDKYREPLYALGAVDVYEDNSDYDIPEVGEWMEFKLNERKIDRKNLMPLRIPGGWTVDFNRFENVDIDQLPPLDKDTCGLLSLKCDLVRERDDKVEKQKLQIYLELYPNGDPNGEFALWAVLNNDWYDPLREFSSRDKNEIVETLENWLWEDFYPVRFIDNDFEED